MKNKFFNNILLIVLSLGFIGCEDYVDYEASENYTIVADDYFKTSADYEAALVGTYDVLQWNIYSVMIGDIASDNSFCGGESATDVIGMQKIDDMIHVPNNDQLTSTWKWLYEGINRANYMIENKDKLDFSRKAELYGEVHFLRAYYYFELVKIFGDVPLFTDSRLTASDSNTLTRAPKASVYAQIEKDLNDAIAVLPAEKSTDGRATAFTSHALLGKVYLYQDKFTEAADILEPLIGLYTLPSSLQSVFYNSGQNGPESVFEVQHSKNSNWYDWGFPQGSEGSFAIIHHGPRGYNGSVYASGWSFNVPTQDLYDAYDVTDTRRGVAILDIEAWAESTGAEYSKGYEHTGYFNHKYIPRAGLSGAQQELNYGINFRAIRYADVLLMAAEANSRKASPNETKAQNYLNQVRARAFGNSSKASSSTGATLTKEIWNERRLELAMEGHRFYDLVRTGEAAAKITGFVSGKHEVFPIPQTEIDISGLTQNAGY
ncbi:MAG: RagB/SusD family nutrient uptake outer membrane protein [Flavobacteriaceae bacterium]|nr:RagB/SusD family nutrient uptake outer membrane protein [Flavobacteriaceae bacterium]